MATFSSHILDATSGRPAAGIRVECKRLAPPGQPEPVFDVRADEDGRISAPVNITPATRHALYEVVFHSAAHFGKKTGNDERQIMRTIVMHITMPEPERRYHIPVIIAPHACSTWWSE